MDIETIRYYKRNASDVADRYESVMSSLSAHFERSLAPASKILDIGCGSGRDMAALHRLGFDVFGVDPTQEFVDYAQGHHPELDGKIALGSLPDLSPPFGGAFDGVLCSAVLMHIPVESLSESAKAIRSCVKANGRLLYSVPSQRADVGAAHRDANGRLFIPNQGSRLLDIFQSMNFHLVDRWGNADSMGRDGVEWDSVLLESRVP
jgi:2-polyprenyl-3-methyl-5-hydroxy-6-metoxy-1,4-benzoquinol methylase